MAPVLGNSTGSDTDRSQPEAWMFTNHAFEDALANNRVAPLTSRGLRTMEDEQQRIASVKAAAMVDAQERPAHLNPPTIKNPVSGGKPRRGGEAEGSSSSLVRKFRFGGSKGVDNKRQVPVVEHSGMSGWTFTNPLALLEPESKGPELEAAIERAKERAKSSTSVVPPLSLGALPAHLSPDRANPDLYDSEDDDEEEVAVVGSLREKYQPMVTPRDYALPVPSPGRKAVDSANSNEEGEAKRAAVGQQRQQQGEEQPLVPSSNGTDSPSGFKSAWKNLKHLDTWSGSGKTREPLSPASPAGLAVLTPQGSISGALTPGHLARGRLGQPVAFDSPASPLLRPQECFTPSFSRTSAPAGVWTRCSVERWRKKGNGKSSKFVLRSESGEILLAAKRSKVERVIRFFRPNWETNYSECVGLAHYDALGAQFVLRGADVREKVTTDALMAILFGLTSEGPRQVTTVLPDRDNVLPKCATIEDLPTLGGPRDVDAVFKAINTRKSPNNVQVFKSSMPVWDPRSKTFRMDFNGRVKKPSVKNMKLQSAAGQHSDSENNDPQEMKQRANRSRDVFMCGRVSANTFVCDFQAPLTPLEAFCIACADLIHKPIYNWI